MGYQPIENYGIIGDLHTVALVGMNGSIDFMCFPRFDSPSIFAALLDEKRGGRFQISPVRDEARHKQIYLPDSNILLTRFLFDDGVSEISDFMPYDEAQHTHAHDLIRRAKTIRGEIHYRLVFAPKFDYGRSAHRIEESEHAVTFIPENKALSPVRLRIAIPYAIANGELSAEFALHAGESASFVMEEVRRDGDHPSQAPDYVSDSFKTTLNFWRRWVGQSKYRGRWAEMVNRSALLLKLLTYKPTGSIVAAPTFGLPEVIGGGRNWDYRYTWIRDASFTLYGLIRLGYTDEAAAFMKWIEARCNELGPDGSLQIMYGIDGHHELTEEELPHFEGYKGSSPVRVGNGAYNQLQLDIYGELMDAVYLYNKHGAPISHDLWQNLVRLLNWVSDHWNQKDEGIWEVRGGRQEFLYSRVMCWVALDRGVRLATKQSFPAPLDKWLACRDRIYKDVFDNYWSNDRKAFMQYKGANALDASNLLMPLVRFISPVDPRWRSTLEAIEHNLVYDSLVYRYQIGNGAPDGLLGEEGTFSMCSFWYVECLSRSGDIEKARYYFEKMLGYANHLGLYAEELGPRAEHLGNFPQAFTHLGLISAAYDLNRRLFEAGQNA
jgi:GH15 family glucan-1,4-alpha-glucosidase